MEIAGKPWESSKPGARTSHCLGLYQMMVSEHGSTEPRFSRQQSGFLQDAASTQIYLRTQAGFD